MKTFVISAIIFGLVIGLSSVPIVQLIHAITATPKSYSDGLAVGKSDCRGGRSYFTDGHTNVWISGYSNGWQSSGCDLTKNPKFYNDGVIVGKSDCRGGRSYFTDDHTDAWISGYNAGWQSSGCRL